MRAVSRRLVRKAWRKPAPTILMYHRIAEPLYDPWGLAVQLVTRVEDMIP